ncbi:PQQ-binding-like beta-propeller repeat protein [Paenibacillus sp. XY044]|uniref:PQQ-binding-like beta-propeller repeat protein n=1 Tax=Paenibacillus sp. XY044 TaxID=2026089 RepID=UPI000B9813EB|nr:PQQ-binding-like beta-propeller repeat protein [Paenibacillus sp. XY044]OZB90460.1 hypothetical protein CJP46_33405 [Paenibacillus sp. XY044]
MSRTFSRLLTACTAGLLLMFGLLPGFSHAAAESGRSAVEWSRDYGSQSSGEGVIPTSDGGYLALGDIYDMYRKAYVVKLDGEGQVEWEQKLAYYDWGSSTAYRAIETKDGGYLIAGNTSEEFEPIRQLFLIRLDASGKVVWQKAMDVQGYDQNPKSIVETEDGSFLIAGSGIVHWVAYDRAYITKIDQSGNTLWYNQYSFSGSDYLTDLIPASDGGYIAVGHAGMVEYESREHDAMLVMKIDDQGKEVWSKQSVEPRSGWTAYSVIPAEDGGYMILSRKSVNGNGVPVLTKTDLTGKVQWEKTYQDGTNSQNFNRLVQTEEGYAMLGEHVTYLDWSAEWKHQYGVLSVNRNGELISRELFKGPPIYRVGTASGTLDGGYIFPGTVQRGDGAKFQLMKLTPPADQPPAERMLTGIEYTEKEKKLKTGSSVSTVLQAVYDDGTKSDLSNAAVYVSGDGTIADVDALGRITGREPGNTYVEASYEGYTARLNVTVLPEDTNEYDPLNGYLTLDSNEYSLSEGSAVDIKVFLYDYNTQMQSDITKQVQFSSSHPDIAEVDEEGNLIGHKPGLTQIYAEYRGGRTSAPVQVVRAAAPIGKDIPVLDGTESGTPVEE